MKPEHGAPTNCQSKESSHVIQLGSDVGVQDGMKAFTTAPEHCEQHTDIEILSFTTFKCSNIYD